MPNNETLEKFGATGATLAIHLAIHALGQVVEEFDTALRHGLPGRDRCQSVLAG